MKLQIICDQIFSTETAEITVNGVTYKDVRGLNLNLDKDGHGSLTITHGSGYIEAYQAEKREDS